MNIYHFASNYLQDVKNKFFEILENYYTKNELVIIFQRILEHFNYSFSDNNIYFNQSELILLSEYIQQLIDKKPLAYILGYTYFYKYKFFVNSDVLIPRPETEELVEYVSQQIKSLNKSAIKIIDIGTGSGCIAITLKKLLPDAEITAIDISPNAIKLANKNADYHQVKIQLKQMDIMKEELNEHYDVIVSNPPYIPFEDKENIDDIVKKYEPSIALFSNTPTEFYQRIFDVAKNRLTCNGRIILEVNQNYASDILSLANQYEYLSHSKIIKDISGNDRIIDVMRK